MLYGIYSCIYGVQPAVDEERAAFMKLFGIYSCIYGVQTAGDEERAAFMK